MYLLPCILTLTLLTACSSSSVSTHKASASAVSNSKEEINYVVVEGLYSNYDYAFSVSVPQRVIGCREPAPLPNHGFGIDLTEKSCRWMERAKNDVYPKSYFNIDASYNSLEWKSLDDALNANIGYLKDSGATDVSIVQREPAQLSKLPAIHCVLRYNTSGESYVEEMVIAFRKEKDTEIVYTIDLVTPASRYDSDRTVLAEMQKTWSLQPLP